MKAKTVLWLLLIAGGTARLAGQDVATLAKQQLATAWQNRPGDCLTALRLLITHSEKREKEEPSDEAKTPDQPPKQDDECKKQKLSPERTDEAQCTALKILKNAGVGLPLGKVGLYPPGNLVGWMIAAIPPITPAKSDKDKKAQSDEIKKNADTVLNKKIYPAHLDDLYRVYKAHKDQPDPKDMTPFLYLLEAVPQPEGVDYASDLTTLRVAYAHPGEDWSLFDLVNQIFEKGN